MKGHRASIIAFMGFLALFIIHWAAAPGAAERPLLPGGAVQQDGSQDALPERSVLIGENDTRDRQTTLLPTISPGAMSIGPVRETGSTHKRIFAAGQISATDQGCPAGAVPPVESGFISMDRGFD